MKFGTGENKAKRVMPGMSAWVNMLDYTATVLPVTFADKNIDVFDKSYRPISDKDEKAYIGCKCPSLTLCCMDMLTVVVDDAALYDGAHVAVQIVGRRFQEEKILAITEILGDALGKHVV
jgi:amidase